MLERGSIDRDPNHLTKTIKNDTMNLNSSHKVYTQYSQKITGMANEDKTTSKEPPKRGIAINGNDQDSPLRMDSQSLAIHERNKAFFIWILLLFHSLFRAFGRCHL